MIVEGVFKDLEEGWVARWAKRCRDVGANAPGNYKGAVVKPDGYFLQQMPEEYARWLTLLQKVYPSKGRCYFEIGVASGGSIRLVTEGLSHLKFVGMDLPSHGNERLLRLTSWLSEKAAGLDPFPAPIMFFGSSHSKEARQWLDKQMGRGQASLFATMLDGDHREEGVYEDFGLVEPYCTVDTYVGVHDVVAPHVKGGVQRAIDRVVKEGRFEQVGYVEQEGEDHPCGLAVMQRSM